MLVLDFWAVHGVNAAPTQFELDLAEFGTGNPQRPQHREFVRSVVGKGNHAAQCHTQY